MQFLVINYFQKTDVIYLPADNFTRYSHKQIVLNAKMYRDIVRQKVIVWDNSGKNYVYTC